MHCFHELNDLQFDMISIAMEVECFENDLLVPMSTS